MNPFWHTLALFLCIGSVLAVEATDQPSRVESLDWSRVTGADIDESIIERVLHVDASADPGGDGSAAAPYATIGPAIEAVDQLLIDGVHTKILIQPGTYREGEWTITAYHGASAETLLVIEGAEPGTVRITGTDLFPLDAWETIEGADGSLYFAHDWPHDFGFNPGGWKENNPKEPYQHRSELMFVDGEPQRHILLERYEYIPVDPNAESQPPTDDFAGVPQNTDKHGSYTYLGTRDPSELPPGSFGVMERPENGDRIFWKPAPGMDPEDVTIEVATRRHHLWIHRKGHVVLRNLDFHGVAGQIEAHAAVMVGHWWQPDDHMDNRQVLIEDCRFQYNNNTQLELRRCQDLTLRRVEASHGGYGGIGMNGTHNVLWEDTTVAFNCWRVPGGWSAGGVKIHRTLDMITRNHTAVGNDGVGLWFDITCGDILVEGLHSIGNRAGFDWEISRGVLVRDSVLVDNEKASAIIPTGEDLVFERCLFAGSPGIAHFIFQASDRESDTWPYEVLGREDAPELYKLDRLEIRDCALVAWPQPADAPGGSDHDGIYEAGWEPYLFFQHHGNPWWFEDYVDQGVIDADNLWYSPRSEAFGVKKKYPDDAWRTRAPECVTIDFDAWDERVAGDNSIWAEAMFPDPENYDLRPKAGSPLEDIPVPRWRMDPELLDRWRTFQNATWHHTDELDEHPQARQVRFDDGIWDVDPNAPISSQQRLFASLEPNADLRFMPVPLAVSQ